MKERVIYLKDLFFVLCKKWRIAVIVMLAFAVLMNFYAWNNAKKAQSAAGTQGPALDELRSELTEKEILDAEQRAEIYAGYYQQYAALAEYMEKSVYFKLDPKAAPTYSALFYADQTGGAGNTVVVDGSSGSNNTAELISGANVLYALNEVINGEETEEKAAAALQMSEERQYVRELYRTEIIGSNLLLTVHAATEADAEKIGKLISDQVESKSKDFNEIYGDYTVTKVEERTYTGADAVLLADISSVISRNSSLESIMKTNRDNVPDAEKNYYNALVEYVAEESMPDSAVQPQKSVKLVYPKWIVVGLFLGLVIYLLAAVLGYVLSDKIKTSEEVYEYFGIPLLAEIQDGKRTKIDVAFSKNKPVFDPEKGTDVAVDRVLYRKDRKEGENLLIMTESDDERVNKVTQMLSEKLNHLNEVSVVEKNLTSSENQMQILGTTDCVIITERLRKTSYDSFLREVNAAKEAGTEIVGAVVIRD